MIWVSGDDTCSPVAHEVKAMAYTACPRLRWMAVVMVGDRWGKSR